MTQQPPPGQSLLPDLSDLPPLETFYNPAREEYTVDIVCPEFTSVCPKTGMPDFGTITLSYSPEDLCLELKSWKYFLYSFRNRGIFYEALVDFLATFLNTTLAPRRLTVIGKFTPRGGIHSIITAHRVSPKRAS